MTDFNPGKAAETAATVLADLKHRAADTLEKVGVASVLETASEKITGAAGKASNTAAEAAGMAADKGAQAAADAASTVGEQGGSTVTSIREWLADFVTTLGSRTADAASKSTQVSGMIESVLNSLQSKTAATVDSASETGSKMQGLRLDPDTLAQVSRIFIVIGTALSGVLAARGKDSGEVVKETVTAAEEEGKQRVDDLARIAKVIIGAIAEAIVAAMQQSEAREQELRARLEEAAQRVPEAMAEVVPETPTIEVDMTEPEETVPLTVEKKKGVGFFRWLLLGIVAGVGISYYRSRQDDDDAVWEQPSNAGQTNSTTSYWPSASSTPAQAQPNNADASHDNVATMPEATSSDSTTSGDATA